MNALHPTAVLCLWASAAVFIQTLPEPWLWLGVSLIALLAGVTARVRFFRLTRRIRLLCAVTLLLFALATPGVRVVPALTGLPLTWDGLWLGGRHAARLIAMVALVAILLERLSVERLICALHHGMRFLGRWGVPVDRIAVRLSLVLAAMERPDTGWRAWLLDAEAPVAPGVTTVPLQLLGALDGACIILSLGIIVGWGLA